MDNLGMVAENEQAVGGSPVDFLTAKRELMRSEGRVE